METIRDLDEATIQGLTKLCKLNHDSSEGFRDAASKMDSDAVADTFRVTSSEREKQRDELATCLGINHESIPDCGTALGTAHRWWMDARSALNAHDDEVVLIEAERGEGAIEDAYEDVLIKTAGSPVNELLQRHLEGIKSSRRRIERLREMNA